MPVGDIVVTRISLSASTGVGFAWLIDARRRLDSRRSESLSRNRC